MIVLFLATLISMGSSSHSIEASKYHAIYISVLEINREEQSIKIKVFSNDLSDAIFNHSKKRIDIQTQSCSTNKSSIEAYFKEHLIIKVNGKSLSPSLQSCEINDASIWLNFSFKSSNTWQMVEVKADYLMELFPTQSNVVSVFYKGEKKMFRLTKTKNIESIAM